MPTTCEIPTSIDKIEEKEGEQDETLEPEADNTKTDKIITKVNEYLKQFEGAVPEGKEE